MIVLLLIGIWIITLTLGLSLIYYIDEDGKLMTEAGGSLLFPLIQQIALIFFTVWALHKFITTKDRIFKRI